MKIIGFNGSPRVNGNTSILINTVFEELHNEGIETELIQIGGRQFHPCTACSVCYQKQDERCHIKNDLFNECIQKIKEADGILLGSPVYFADITPEMKAFIDIVGYVARANKGLFRRKIGAGVIAVRRAGAIHSLDSINHLFQVTEMIIPGSTYWNLGMGRNIGDVLNDTEGIETMRNLGKNIAWLLKKIK